ncbi:Uu.00g068120.m01.CDS01 [Anthostomella pinea]|uniref:Uu.00g068120.m01.CDS01 n=1 Tax=Anthostomella pinea TaxID=933095 RepID=A0AAI8VU93_9PEZI|nr:Uu.00g068120.m01.CDS01 [Anthostomella pinea]
MQLIKLISVAFALSSPATAMVFKRSCGSGKSQWCGSSTYNGTVALSSHATAMSYKRSCESGKYQCGSTTNGTATVQVCSGGLWLHAATCADGWKCVSNEAGGCTCQT